ncbi:hypothetical protein KIN20_006997 [Parelaphostrongylus tenuis]|uniref:Uncharacterized protein n=1 Tax=Parelaphostrongylus tenuis TaxID=148309 RepID=A0AAD5M2N6_PARTN|nr:hypothetical protein KIN20_006997 [Parelaphostrongylus tenuis]
MLKLNIGGMSFRIRMASLFSRTEEEKLVMFALMDHERRIRSCDAFIVVRFEIHFESLLASLFVLCIRNYTQLKQEAGEYYFERSSVLFDSVFKYYITGQLHRPLDVCHQEFSNELGYWNIPESLLSTCCLGGQNRLSISLEQSTHKNKEVAEIQDQSLRSRIHNFCEGDGSLLSTLFTFGSISFVLISVIGLILGTIHEFQVPIVKYGAVSTSVNNVSTVNNPKIIWEPHSIFGYIETFCITWFTFEFVLRLAVTPSRQKFLVGIMNIVDMTAIIPFYLELGLAIFGIDVSSLHDIKGALLVVRVLRVLRVVRILKLGRYSSGMRTFAITLRSSARQLGMMGMVLTTGVVFFSTLLYFVEKDEEDTPFTSIPATFWWAIVTMTTVGYGDCVPVTIPGKLIASGAIISGVLVLALPITIIVDNFMKVSGSTTQIFSKSRPPTDIAT